ncbi:MAG: hypothetical protein P8X50_00515 [Maritimibacter sp.]|jgi:hypothetical protein
MSKRIATLNVIAWGGFWAFGYLAITAGATQPGQMLMAGFLAALGGGIGLWCYLRLVDHSEKIGYRAPGPRKQQKPEHHSAVLADL